MASVITARDPTPASLDECTQALAAWGFDPREKESVAHAAHWLRRLGNDRRFLGDLLVDMLSGLAPVPAGADALASPGPHSIMLATPGRGSFFIRANIWPAASDPVMRASGPEAFSYGQAHDHNYDFLTLGYFGPGYEVEEFEYEHESVTGWAGEPVRLCRLGRSRLKRDRIRHYRAHRDIHRLLPPESLSISLKLAHTQAVQGWLDHYVFDAEAGRIASVHGHGPSESFLRVAVALGGDEARDLALHFGRTHASERMRLHAWEALAATAGGPQERDEVWRAAEAGGSRLVAEMARRRRVG
ncbi:MAG TPA: transposase [Novosphingobium sp.]|nr:transposase [Novosphingobium sp.]